MRFTRSGAHDRAARQRRAHRREVARLELGVLGQRDQHGRHARHRCRPLRLDQVEHQARTRTPVPGRARAGARRSPSAPRPQPAVWNSGNGFTYASPGAKSNRPSVSRRVVRQSAMVQQRALRKAGRARRVLDLDRVVGTHVGELLAWATPDARKASNSVKSIASRRPGSSPRTDSSDSAIGLPRNSGQQEDAGRARLLQHVLELAGLVRRVDGHQDQAGQRRAELEHLPLRDVRRPHRHALARARSARAARARSARRRRAARRTSSAAAAPGSGCPPISAGWSGTACAASRRIPPTVVSSTCSLWSAG